MLGRTREYTCNPLDVFPLPSTIVAVNEAGGIVTPTPSSVPTNEGIAQIPSLQSISTLSWDPTPSGLPAHQYLDNTTAATPNTLNLATMTAPAASQLPQKRGRDNQKPGPVHDTFGVSESEQSTTGGRGRGSRGRKARGRGRGQGRGGRGDRGVDGSSDDGTDSSTSISTAYTSSAPTFAAVGAEASTTVDARVQASTWGPHPQIGAGFMSTDRFNMDVLYRMPSEQPSGLNMPQSISAPLAPALMSTPAVPEPEPEFKPRRGRSKIPARDGNAQQGRGKGGKVVVKEECDQDATSIISTPPTITPTKKARQTKSKAAANSKAAPEEGDAVQYHPQPFALPYGISDPKILRQPGVPFVLPPEVDKLLECYISGVPIVIVCSRRSLVEKHGWKVQGGGNASGGKEAVTKKSKGKGKGKEDTLSQNMKEATASSQEDQGFDIPEECQYIYMGYFKVVRIWVSSPHSPRNLTSCF